MSRPLDGQVALVTGAGSGMGAEIAGRLAQQGAAVGVNGRSEQEVADTIERIISSGGRTVAAVGDVSLPDDVQRFVHAVDDQLGGLHIVVNNAGLQSDTPFLELDLAGWRAQLAVDLDGAFLVASAACRLMVGRGGGVVVNVTSVHEHQPRPGFAAYCTAKAGLGMLTRCMARELAPHGIRVLSVAPGAIETPIQGERPSAGSRRPASRRAGWACRRRWPR